MQKRFNHVRLPIEFSDIPTTNKNGARFYLCEGEHFPSVTTVTGWKKRKFFAEWRRNNPKESKRVLNRGNLLHETIEDYLNNKEINLLSTEDIENYFTQATAYAIMWHERTGNPIHKFNILMSTEDSCKPQVFSGRPVDYVQNLYESIKYYKKETEKILS